MIKRQTGGAVVTRTGSSAGKVARGRQSKSMRRHLAGHRLCKARCRIAGHSEAEESVLFRQNFLKGIREGRVTAAFRRWRRPTVRAGGTLLTPVGQLHIKSVSQVALDRISQADACSAGYESLDALLAELSQRSSGDVYRIEFGPLRPDPRVKLRKSPMRTDGEFQGVLQRLRLIDSHSAEGPWTRCTLEAIRLHPGLRAGDLCKLVGLEKEPFKLNVRKLKNLGLTESLGTGYRLSARGEAFVQISHSADKEAC